MNRQPFQTPPKWWEPQMSPWLVRLMRGHIHRTLVRDQRITRIELEGAEHVERAIASGAGVLVTPNHSFHYDSYVMIEAAHRVGRPFHFLTAWQVFEMGSRFERFMLQKHGCFSINREANDLQAFKQSVEILRESEFPLVIFPEGDVYHHNDRVAPFREGAAAIALSAAKKAARPIVAIPCALKAQYVVDPKRELEGLMSRLEESVHWQPKGDRTLTDRIYAFAEALLTLKELEHLGAPQAGSIAERTARLGQWIVERLERQHGITSRSTSLPDRVKELRKAIINQTESPNLSNAERGEASRHMDQLFFVMQLYSYPGDYVAEDPSIERIAETLDKFEEDVLKATYPAIRGERHVVVKFGEPIEIAAERHGRDGVGQLTQLVQDRVQQMLDDINAQRRPVALPRSLVHA
jgi:hypothetical protein